MAAQRIAVPIISSRWIFSFIASFDRSREAPIGVEKKIIIMAAMAPKGILIRKHHRQLARVVKAPPRRGAIIVANPYIAV